MTKVLHIINGADLGGISTIILNYYKNMDRTSYQFDFCMYDKQLGYNGKVLEKLGSKFYTVPSKKRIFKYVKVLSEILQNGNYDVIHVHTNTSSYVPLWVAKKHGINIRVAHAHSAVIDQSFSYRLKVMIGKVLIHKYATIMCPCSSDAGRVVFGERGNIKIVPNAIDTVKYAFDSIAREKVRKEWGISENEYVLGMVGRLSEEKNTEYAIKIFKKLSEKNSSYKLVIAGDGILRKKLENLVLDLELSEMVIFLGQRSDANKLYQGFDLYLLPSKYEGFPIAALEAMTSGLPIVLSDNITKDINFGRNMKYIAIDETSIENWCVTIEEFREKTTRSDGQEVKIHGYDIKDAVHVLENIYKKIG